jgi:hypothetical protein
VYLPALHFFRCSIQGRHVDPFALGACTQRGAHRRPAAARRPDAPERGRDVWSDTGEQRPRIQRNLLESSGAELVFES